MPCFEWAGYAFAGTLATQFKASIEVTLDNISEDEHFAFIHSTFGWDESAAPHVEIVTKNYPDRSEVRLAGQQRRSPISRLGGIRARDVFRNEWVTRFDPVHAIYTFWWEDPRSGVARPITTRAVVFLVPETQATTHAHMFLFLKIAPSIQSLLRPAVHWLARRIALKELERDARFAAYLCDAPTSLRGMRLTKFDKALIHNRKLLQKVYWGAGANSGSPTGIDDYPITPPSCEEEL